VKVAALDLFAKWRNVVAHSSERSARLVPERRTTLLEAASDIYDRYSHLDIALAIQNFESRKVPVPKEVTSLIAIAVNLSRQMDEAAIRRFAGTPERIPLVADRMLHGYFERSVEPLKELSDAWQGDASRRLAMLKKIFASVGMTESDARISEPLPETFLEEVVALSRDEFALRFGITRPNHNHARAAHSD
jgi:hypothetical protein